MSPFGKTAVAGRLPVGEKIAESPSQPGAKGSHPSVRPSASVGPAGPRTRPSLLRSFLPREFLFIIVVIVIEGRSKETPAHCHCYRSARSAVCFVKERVNGIGDGRGRTDRRREAEDVAANDDVPVSPARSWVGWEGWGTDKYLLPSSHFREILLL